MMLIPDPKELKVQPNDRSLSIKIRTGNARMKPTRRKRELSAVAEAP